MDINPLSVISFADIFSLSVGCLILLSQIIDVGIVFNIQKKVLKTGLINFSPGSRKCSFYTSIIVIPTSLSLPFFFGLLLLLYLKFLNVGFNGGISKTLEGMLMS